MNINTDKMYDDNDKPNAMIYIDMFEAKKASHTTTITNAELVIGKTENIIIPDPKPIYGIIDINSEPMEATIYIDGVKRGETPAILYDVIIGSHELRLEKSGCATLTKSFTLDETNTLSINEKLMVEQDEVIEEYVYEAPKIEEEVIEEAEIFMSVEEQPEFPGGSGKLMEFIQKNLKYPMMARESGIQGRVFVCSIGTWYYRPSTASGDISIHSKL